MREKVCFVIISDKIDPMEPGEGYQIGDFKLLSKFVNNVTILIRAVPYQENVINV